MEKTTYLYLITKFYAKTRPATVFAFAIFLLALFNFSNSFASWVERSSSYSAPTVMVPCNTDLPVPLTNSDFTGLEVSKNTTGVCSIILGCSLQNEENLIDGSETSYASARTLIGLGVTHTLRVTDNTLNEFYIGGSYAGFLIENTSVLQANLLNNIVIRTYLDGALQESNSGTSLAAINTTLLGANKYYAGFYTTQNFDAIEISISSLLGVASTTNIYYAVTNNFCTGPALENNTPTAFVKPTFPAKIVDERTGVSGLTVGSVNNVLNAIDSNTNNYASINMVAGVLGSASISIKDALVDYPAQTYAGFDIETSSVLNLALLDNFTVRTYLDGVVQETRTGGAQLISLDSGLLLTGSERSQVGFVASKPFDEVRLTLNQPISVNLGFTRVYGLVLEAFAEGEIDCDLPTILNNPQHPVIINNIHTGVNGVLCVGCEVDNATNVISESTTDFAMINVVAGVASTASIAVENVLSTFPAGTETGFLIRDTNDILQVDLLNSLTITTYLNGVQQESKTGSGLLALEALGLINLNPSQTNDLDFVGFVTSLPYDEVQLTVGSLVGVINSIEVYGSYVDKSIRIQGTVSNETVINAADGTLSVSVSGGRPPYSYLWSPGGQTTSSISGLSAGSYTVTVTDSDGCDATSEFIIYTNGVQYPVPCNTEDPVAITSSGFTDLKVTQNTTGVCLVGCGIFNEANIIDGNTTNYAAVSTLVGLGVTHSLRVTDETVGEFFNAGGYAGFLIENSSILQVDLLNAIVITTYLNGVLQETKTSTSLVAIGSSILSSGKFYVGFYTTQDYDAVEISIASLVDVIATTRIYHAVTNSFCEGPELQCNTATRLTKPNFPVRVVEEHTGMGGLLTLGQINNINRAIDSNPNNYASIDLLAGVAGTASIAFKDEISDYPANTYAGFDIENASILTTDLLDAVTISTYLDGTLVESKTGSTELVPLDSGLLLTGSESIRLGFITTQPFDEVRLSMTQLVSLDLGSTRVYGMVLQSFCPGTINCDEPYVLSNPNNSVIISNAHTGTSGLACVACEVDNAVNVISANNSDFALINVVAGVAGSASISVQDVLTDYPAGTAAGFVIRDTNSLLQADLLNTLTITTYLNGIQQEQKTADNLLALEALGLVNITPTAVNNFYVVSFVTSSSFDEIQLTVTSLVAAINSIEVYGGYVDTTNTTFCQEAGIALLKQGVFNDVNNDGCSNVGETITYTYTATNTGNGSIANVVLTDPLSGSPLSLVSGDINGNNQLDVNETWIYNLVYAITQDDIDTGSVSGQATITGVSSGGINVSDLSDDTSPLEDDFTVTILCQTEGIALIKQGNINDEDEDGCSDEDETITFILTVTNQGNTTLSSVNVADPLISVVYTSGDIDSDGKLDVNETWIYTGSYIINATDIATTYVENQATVEAISVSGATVTDLSHFNSVLLDGATTVDLCQEPGIAVIKTAVFNDENADGCTNVGETLTYTFTVTNQGNTGLVNVVLEDPLLGGLVALSSGDLNTYGILDVGEIWIYTGNYIITQNDIDAGSITNQATVSGESSSGISVNDLSDDDSVLEDDATVTVLCQRAAVAIIKEGVFNDENANGCSDAGETITYTFTVTNQGNVSINTIAITDPLLTGSLVFVSGDTNSDNVLDVNETWIYTSDYEITQSNIDNGSVNNQATVTGIGANGVNVSDLSDNDSILENNVTVTALCQSPGIALIKTAVFNDENANGCSDVGETITYAFTVTNQGNVSIRSLAINDSLITGAITLVSGDSDADGELDVNETWVYTATYTITQSDIDAGSISNQATVTGVGADGTAVSDLSDDDSILEDGSTVTTLCQSSGIALIKTAVFNDENANNCSDVGETIAYTFTVSNQGNVSVRSVTISDPLITGAITLVAGDFDADDELDVNENWVYTASYTITQSDIDAGSISNQATVTGVGANGTAVSDLSDDDSILEDGSTVTTLCQSSGIALIKTAVFNDENANNCSDVGETIAYTFTVSNQGNVSVRSVTISDPLITGAITLVAGDSDADDELDVNETWVYTATYTITQSDIDAGSISNQATVTGIGANGVNVSDLSDNDSILENNVTVTALCQSPGIALIKTAVFNDENANGCSDVGETIAYTFTVTNQGNVSVRSVTISDPLITGAITLVSGDFDADGELDVYETWTYTASYTITQSDIDAGSISNQATVTGVGANGTAVSDLSDDDSILENDSTVTALCQTAGIVLIKTAVFNDENANNCSDVGETIAYTFTVSNQGNVSVRSVTISDPLITGAITLVAGDFDADDELDVNENWVYTASYTITQSDIDAGSISNQATVTGVGADGTAVSDLSDDDSILEDGSTVTTLCQSSGIALIKTAVFNDENANNCSDVGETIAYTFTVSNQGNVSVRSVTISDPLITGAITLVAGDFDADDELDVNETWTYTASYTITQSDIDAGSISNQATVTGVGVNGTAVSDLSDDDSVLENDSTVTTLCQSSGIALIKTAVFNDENANGCSDVGETITYTFTVTNQGNVSIRSLAINDSLITGAITLVSGDSDSDGELDVNETWTYIASYTITQSDIDAGSISNQATVTGVGADGTAVSDLSDDDSVLENDSTVTTLCQSEGIALIKTAVFNDENDNGCSDVGETITYTFIVTNQGNTAIENILLTDSMLSNITLDSGDMDMDNQLDVGETWIYTGVFTLTDLDINSRVISNQATIEGVSTVTGNTVADISDDDSVFEDDPTVTTLCAVSSISLEKVGVFNDENGNGSAQVGETITYTFTVYNTGQTTLSNIIIQDDALPGLVMQGGPIVQLLPGAVDNTTYTATYTIRQQDIERLSITNQALVTAVDSSGNTITDLSDDPTNFDDVDIDNDGDPDDATVTVLPDPADDDFRIFNAISPDGDGQNDFFRIKGIENYPDNNLKIYNRWGVLIYEADAYGVNGKVFRGFSDGRVTISKNEALPTGTYFYILTRRIANQETLINKGYLYIKRN